MSQVAVIMGSASDYETMSAAVETLQHFGVEHEVEVVSAHRTPEAMFEYAKTAAARGLQVIIAGAGGAAHLPGMVSSLTSLPVLGVPVQSKALSGVDSLYSIVQMPAGVPTATFAIGTSGATNAALFAVRILALRDEKLRAKLQAYRDEAAAKSKASTRTLGKPAKKPAAQPAPASTAERSGKPRKRGGPAEPPEK